MIALLLPDITAHTDPHFLPLDWLGMCDIALPVQLAGQRLSARANAGVSLKQGRGIHMSRLYLALQSLESQESQELSPPLLRQVLQTFLDSHLQLSDCAYLRLHGEALLSRPALVSPLSGWKAYAFEVRAHLEAGMFHVELQVKIASSGNWGAP